VPEVGSYAGLVAPTVETFNLEAGVLEKDSEPSGGETPEVGRLHVDADEERRADQDVAPGACQLHEGPGRPPWVDDVLEDLLAYHDVEGFLDLRGAKVELGESQTSIGLPGTVAMEVPADLDRCTPIRVKGVNDLVYTLVHDDTAPLTVGQRLERVQAADGRAQRPKCAGAPQVTNGKWRHVRRMRSV